MSEIDLKSREHADVSEGQQVHVVFERDGDEESATATVINDEGNQPTIETDDDERYILNTQRTSYNKPSVTPLGQRGGYKLLSAEVLD